MALVSTTHKDHPPHSHSRHHAVTTTTAQSTQDHPPIVSWTSPTIVKDIHNACSTWGAFVLTDHGIPASLLKHVLETSHAFFQLPQASKEKYHLKKQGAKWRGYMPLGGERSCQGTVMDWKEGLYLGDDHAENHPLLGLPTFGSNVYPDEELPLMKPLFIEYHKQMKQLGNDVMQVLSLGLGLSRHSIQDKVTLGDPIILPRVFYYPPVPTSAATKSTTPTHYGIGPHSDYGFWTMIVTDAPGLEFCHPTNQTWHGVPHIPNSIVMNVGDVLDRLSGGHYISAYHRVRTTPNTTPRMSLPFFYDPHWHARLQPLLGTTTQQQPVPSIVHERWSRTKLTAHGFDGTVEYSEFLSKKVAKVFPSLIPPSTWRNLRSTTLPSTRHAVVVDTTTTTPTPPERE